ncbi:hypothetical protein JCM19235_781 [Vibrio maritimus]|uniref:Uncharacterized protein n=1 Tax=Vibrio maritimus TaxID=990268 RepID=A0A090RVH0_9VIBR|nr:hypothetical protein JCM19235_781 [Vibrio maritimus]
MSDQRGLQANRMVDPIYGEAHLMLIGIKLRLCENTSL